MSVPNTGQSIRPDSNRINDAQPPCKRIPFDFSQIGFCSAQFWPLSLERNSRMVVDQRSLITLQPLSNTSPEGRVSKPGACKCLATSRGPLQVFPPSRENRVQVLYSPLKSTRVVR